MGTTSAPTTEPTKSPTPEPTTSNPTTSNPTTSRPTTSNPTTSNPTTSDPTMAPKQCGDSICHHGEYCCNESCGICAPNGGHCTQQFCGTTPSPTTDDNGGGGGGRTPRPTKYKAPKTPRPIKERTPRPTMLREKTPRPTKPAKTPKPTTTYLRTPQPTMKPTEDESTGGWGTSKPSHCCKDQISEQDCLDNANIGKSCLWLQKDSPLAVKFNTQCLGEALVKFGPSKKTNFESDAHGPIVDECHPIAVMEYEAFNVHVDEKSVMNTFRPAMIGYRFYVEIAGFLAVAMVLIICCRSMCCQKKRKDFDYQPIKDPVDTV